MRLVNFVPLILAFVLTAPMVLAPVSRRVNQVVTRFALVLFGDYANAMERNRVVRQSRLRAAHVPTTFRQYAAASLLYAMLASLVAGIMGMYVIWLGLTVLAIDPATLQSVLPEKLWFLTAYLGVPDLTVMELFTLVTVTSLTLGAVSAVTTYWFRWWYPKTVSDDRQVRIDATLPQSIAFVYALSRSGMAFPEVMRTLTTNRHIYGETAEEMSVAVRHMDLFGMDVITAIHTMSRRSPSTKFKEFSENLASVLQSGRSLSEFLRRQYEEFQDEAEAQQEHLLGQLATLAEAYVTVFVAGPLFLITTLVIVGVTVANTLRPLRTLVYLILPLANLGFIIYLTSKTDALSPASRLRDFADEAGELTNVRRVKRDGARADGGPGAIESRASANLERLAAYRRLRGIRRRLGNPVRTVIDRPRAMFYVTIPLSLAFVGWHAYSLAQRDALTIAGIDDVLIQTGLFLVGTFAIVYEVHKRRIEAIEAAVPDLLDRLASVNEAGMTIVESFDRVRGSELGALDDELDRVWTDIRWGADVETALRRFERRVHTQTISRVVTLVTNAMSASGNLATVLRIAAKQAKADRRLKRERRAEMLTYMVVVYISFFVFLFIVVVLSLILIPNLPEQSVVPNATAGGPGPQGVPAVGGVGQIGSIDKRAYKLLFFHTAIVQGLLSGVVAGQLSSGDVREGAKHAAILVALSYATFLVMM